MTTQKIIDGPAARWLLFGVVLVVFLTGFAVAWFLRPSTSETETCKKIVNEIADAQSIYLSDDERDLACEIILDGKVEPWMVS